MQKQYELRPYQAQCKEILDNTPKGRHLVALATGLGKTMIFTHLKRNGRTLLLSHRDELVRQPEKYYEGQCSFGVEKASEHSNGEDVVSASVQTLSRSDRLKNFSPDEFDTIIIDEAHHAAADSYKKILNHFSGANRLIGFTATPKRGDGVKLNDVFDDIIFQRDLRWGIENGYLSHIRCEQVSGDYSLKGVEKRTGDYAVNQLEDVLEHSGAIMTAAKTYVSRCLKRHTLIYCITKKICYILEETIKKMLPESEKDTVKVLTGDTPDTERKQMLLDFSSGKIKCIINCMVLTEGTDLPICDTVISLRPTCNDSLYQQMAGRGTRLHDEKEYCLLFDIVPEEKANTRSLCSAPSLFGIDPSLLSPKQVRELNENNDLMEFCDSLSGFYASEARRLELQIKNVNLFIEDCEDLIQQNKGKTLKHLANAYMKEQEEKLSECGYDFGDLDVTVQADESKYYQFIPNWSDRIFLSRPDILNNVMVQFRINENGTDKNYSGEMKMEEAVELVQKYCSIQESWYRYSWNKKTQDYWKQQDATEKQGRKLYMEYKDTDVKTSTKGLNKLEASKLIDLSIQLKEAHKRSRALANQKNKAQLGNDFDPDNKKKEKNEFVSFVELICKKAKYMRQ